MAYTIGEECTGCGACVRICPAAAVSGEKKALHRIEAGLCIECGACGRVCPQGSVRDAQGEPCLRLKRAEWPRPRFALEQCLACLACIEACPAGSLASGSRLGKSGVRRNYPSLENEGKSCIGCGFCVQACPIDAIVMTS